MATYEYKVTNDNPETLKAPDRSSQITLVAKNIDTQKTSDGDATAIVKVDDERFVRIAEGKIKVVSGHKIKLKGHQSGESGLVTHWQIEFLNS